MEMRHLRPIRSRSVSNPVETRSNSNPIQVTPASKLPWFWSCGKTANCSAGHQCPSTAGPSSTPARIFPSTAGCLNRRATSPRKCATPRSKTSCSRRYSNICGGNPFNGVMVNYLVNRDSQRGFQPATGVGLFRNCLPVSQICKSFSSPIIIWHRGRFIAGGQIDAGQLPGTWDKCLQSHRIDIFYAATNLIKQLERTASALPIVSRCNQSPAAFGMRDLSFARPGRDNRKLARHTVPGCIVENKIGPEGTAESSRLFHRRSAT